MKEICRGCSTADATKATVSLINSFSCFADEFWALLCHRLTVKTHCRRYWRRSNLIFVKEPRIFLSLRCTVIYVSCDWTNPGTTELCLKYTLLRFFFKRSNTSLFWWGIYSITLRSSCIHSHYLMWNPCHHAHCGKDMLSKGSLWDILHSRRSLQMYFDEVGLEIQIFQQELWATSHNGWNLCANSVWHLKFHLLWRKKTEENFQ